MSALDAPQEAAADPRNAGQSHQGRKRIRRSAGRQRPLWATRDVERDDRRNEHDPTNKRIALRIVYRIGGCP
jgi:hypothetical protein